MFIEKIEVENFRSIKECEVTFAEMTTFIGRNGVGKSTLLYALDSFYNVGAQYSHLDFYNHVTADTSIRIRVTYGSLRPEEAAEFAGYVHNGKLTVTKVINQGGPRYYGATAQIRDFADLRRMGAADKRAVLKQRLDAGTYPDFGELPRKAEDVEKAMANYEAAHPELTEPIERETQFLGPKNVGGGKLDKFTKFVLVPAVRDVADEMGRRGAIMQLLDLIVTRSISARRDFQDFKAEFDTKVRQLYGKENLPELGELGRLVTERLRRYAPGSELVIDFDELQPPVIPLPEAIIAVSEDHFKVPVRYSGHGLQRALILALLEQLSITVPAGDGKATQPEVAQPAHGHQLPNLILAIEEPELYLHPARSRYLAKILRDLAGSNGEGVDAAAMQVVCVTHSPYLVDVAHFDEVRMCRKSAGSEAGLPHVTTFKSFTRAQAAQRLAELTGGAKEKFTAEAFVARASPVLNSIVNEGLFADVVVVVEGESDAAALWAMQTIMEHRWDELGVVVVPVGGKHNIDRAVVVFKGFDIPAFFLFDGDKGKDKSGSVEANHLLLKLGGGQPVDYPSTGVAEACAHFEADIESYLTGALGGRFTALRDQCAAQLGHDRPSKALKNAEVMTCFLRKAVEEGFRFEVLEQVVRRVTQIAEGVRAPLGAATKPPAKGTPSTDFLSLPEATK